MAKRLHILTARGVETKTAQGYHADGGGLYLQVTKSAAKSWINRFSLKGRRREMGLGAYPAVALAKAREKCAEARAQVRDGLNPIEIRRREKMPFLRQS